LNLRVISDARSKCSSLIARSATSVAFAL
jgi:hypothetical protein